jgi:nucleobase:cation symporter-1, NCS1 family
VIATAVAAGVAVVPVLLGGSVVGMHTAAQYSWFIGCGIGFALYWTLAARSRLAVPPIS